MGSIARRSSSNWNLTVRRAAGIPAAYSPERARARSMRWRGSWQFRAELPEPNLTFNAGLIAGGATAALGADEARATATGKTNIIAAQAPRARRHARTQPRADRARRGQDAGNRRPPLSRRQGGAHVRARVPPMVPTAGNRALLARLNGVNETSACRR